MFPHISTFRRKLDAGQFCLGSGITLSDPTVTEAIGPSVDFLWIDLEHSALSMESLQAHLIAARAAGAPALVRVPSSDVGWIKRVLDSGAEGLIVPQVHSAEEVRRVAAACRYPTQGQRGFGPRRPSNYGREGGPDYLKSANEQVFVSVQIETAGALAAIDEIVAVPGIDSIVLGPYDLSGALGLPGQVFHPTVVEAITSVVTKARKAGRYVGMGMSGSVEHARLAASWGVQWVQCGGDYSYMVTCVDQLFENIRKAVPPTPVR